MCFVSMQGIYETAEKKYSQFYGESNGLTDIATAQTGNTRMGWHESDDSPERLT